MKCRRASLPWMCIVSTSRLQRSTANSRWCSPCGASSSRISTSGRASILRNTDVVTLEATSNAWHPYDKLMLLVASVTVANPMQVALIAKTLVKTDPATRWHSPACSRRDLTECVGTASRSAPIAGPWRSSEPFDQNADSGPQSAEGSPVRTQSLSIHGRGVWTSQPRLVGGVGPSGFRKAARPPRSAHPGRPRILDQRG